MESEHKSDVAVEVLGHLAAALRLLDQSKLAPRAAALIDHAANIIADAEKPQSSPWDSPGDH